MRAIMAALAGDPAGDVAVPRPAAVPRRTPLSRPAPAGACARLRRGAGVHHGHLAGLRVVTVDGLAAAALADADMPADLPGWTRHPSRVGRGWEGQLALHGVVPEIDASPPRDEPLTHC